MRVITASTGYSPPATALRLAQQPEKLLLGGLSCGRSTGDDDGR